MYHSVNFWTKLVQKLLDNRCIGTSGREHKLSCINWATFHGIFKLVLSTINQFFRHCMVIALRITFCQIFCKHIMPGAGQSIAAHASIILLFISSLSCRTKTNDYISRAYIGIVYDITSLHATSNC